MHRYGRETLQRNAVDKEYHTQKGREKTAGERYKAQRAHDQPAGRDKEQRRICLLHENAVPSERAGQPVEQSHREKEEQGYQQQQAERGGKVQRLRYGGTAQNAGPAGRLRIEQRAQKG